MKLITRDTDYAIRALACMAAKEEEITPVAELVKRLRMPGPFLRKILQILNKNGLLRSYRGKGGGFALARPAEQVFLIDLIKIFQGPFQLNECLFKNMRCPNTRVCILKEKIEAIENYVAAELRSITVASLIGPATRKPRLSGAGFRPMGGRPKRKVRPRAMRAGRGA